MSILHVFADGVSWLNDEKEDSYRSWEAYSSRS